MTRTRPDKKRTENRRHNRARFPWIRLFLLILTCLGMALGGYFYHLHREIQNRFASQKWSIPSRVFSATVLLYPGQTISLTQLKQMLNIRRYRESARETLYAGEYKTGRNDLSVHLRHFSFPGRSLPAQRIRFTFKQNRIWSMEGEQGEAAIVELEPIEIARLFGPERESRLLINIKQVPGHLVDAVLAIEDHRFYEHGGVDFRGIARALWTDLQAGKVVQGGSTITQQLIKNYFLHSKRTLKRKVVEACMALAIEASHSKDEILEMYLNEIYLGQRGSVAIHGVGEAARYYFGRNVEDLTLAETAVLAGMIQGPNSYSPFSNPQAAKERRNMVLKRMLDLGKISPQDYEKTISEPLGATEVALPLKTAPYFVDYVRQQLQDLYEPEVLETRGLNIYTTLHPEMAIAAEESVREGIAELEKKYPRLKESEGKSPLQAVLIALQPKTGSVLALVGGKDYAKSNFNRALYAHRQPGSAIKPFVYLTALDQLTPASWLSDEPTTYMVGNRPWSPKNYDHRYRGRVSLREALEQSLNVATVQLAFAVGLDNIITTTQSLGIRSPIEAVPSLALGAFEVTPIELAGAYAALDNDGQRPFLLSLREVVTEQDEVQQRRNVDFSSVTSPAKAFILTDILQGVVERGTARRARQLGIDFPCAGKTGTTSDYRDSWFVGYTSDLLVLVWIGFDDNRSTGLSGSQGALTIWSRFMSSVRPWMNPQPFRVPPGVVEAAICRDSGQLASLYCPGSTREYFLAERAPWESCTVHAATIREPVPREVWNEDSGNRSPERKIRSWGQWLMDRLRGR